MQARTEQVISDSLSSALPFAANYYDDQGKTIGIFNIRYYPSFTVTQAEARVATPADVEAIDEALQGAMVAGIESAGNRLLEWRGTQKTDINGVTTFISEYRRTSSDGPFRSRLVRVFNDNKSFTMTISYREDQNYFLDPISLHIIRSLRTE